MRITYVIRIHEVNQEAPKGAWTYAPKNCTFPASLKLQSTSVERNQSYIELAVGRARFCGFCFIAIMISYRISS